VAAQVPVDFQSRAIFGAKFITWKIDHEFEGFENTPYTYYVLSFCADKDLPFSFNYSSAHLALTYC
jgi:hypothetical protein